eukprot:SM000079S22470  [mRNA]  locus=s79:353967:355303:- [translate_table: standard]
MLQLPRHTTLLAWNAAGSAVGSSSHSSSSLPDYGGMDPAAATPPPYHFKLPLEAVHLPWSAKNYDEVSYVSDHDEDGSIGDLPSSPGSSIDTSSSSSSSLASCSMAAAAAPGPSHSPHSLYKTELCRSWEETGSCRYGSKCQICRTFNTNGTCPYGTRCRFIHHRTGLVAAALLKKQEARPFFAAATDPAVKLLASLSEASWGCGMAARARRLPIFQQICPSESSWFGLAGLPARLADHF